MVWVSERPTVVGWYWMWKPALRHVCDEPRIIHVWTYTSSPGPLFTNEDGGAPIEDEIYSGCLWRGPIEVPPKPEL